MTCPNCKHSCNCTDCFPRLWGALRRCAKCGHRFEQSPLTINWKSMANREWAK